MPEQPLELKLPENFTVADVKSQINQEFVKKLRQAHAASKTATITTKQFHSKPKPKKNG